MKRLFFTLIVLTAIGSGFAQNSIDLANIYYRNSPSNTTQDANYKTNLSTLGADLKLPLVLNDKNVAIVGLDYQKHQISFTEQKVQTIDFTSAAIQIGIEHQWNAKSKMLFMSMTRLNSNLKSIQFDHFQQGGLVLGTTKHSTNFDWKYGAYYNSEFFGPMFVPLFGFNWKINDDWRLKLIVPLNFELSYQPKDNFIAGLRFDGVNASFRTQDSMNLKSAYIDKADNNIWAFAELEVGKNCWFHLKAGYSILRKYNIYESSDQMGYKVGPINFKNDRQLMPKSFENGISLEVRFIYRLKLLNT